MMIIGIDYASVDGNKAPDLRAFKAACTQAGSSAAIAIFRAAYGTLPDPTLDRDWHAAKDQGLICGGYLYLRMPVRGYTQTPEDQVDVMANVIGALTASDLVPTLDIEDSGVSADLEFEMVTRAWDAIVAIYGVPPIDYTSSRVWREDLKNRSAGAMVDSPLWLAKPWPWQVRTPAQLSDAPFAGGKYDPEVPKPWGAGNWWMHQYQGDAFPVPGFTSTVDLSRFRMMRAGEVGPRVSWVQRRLGIPETSSFDNAMLTSVRGFQQRHQLDVDGIIGPRTFTQLCWQAPGHPLAA